VNEPAFLVGGLVRLAEVFLRWTVSLNHGQATYCVDAETVAEALQLGLEQWWVDLDGTPVFAARISPGDARCPPSPKRM
jgi:hypothetical protein